MPAFLIILLITALLILGTSESSTVNNIIVGIKLAVILFFILIGFGHINPANWSPFLPFGTGGIFRGAAIIFFAYIGFDQVSTSAEEARNPGKDLPLGIILSLVVCMVLYILVTAVLTGMVSYTNITCSHLARAECCRLDHLGWGNLRLDHGAHHSTLRTEPHLLLNVA